MPLSFPNLISGLSPASGALQNKLNPNPMQSLQAKAANVGSSLVNNGRSLVSSPAASTLTTPVAHAAAPLVSAPAAKPNALSTTPGLGTYKGVAINPGNDASVASQVAAIDARSGAPTTGGTTPPPATTGTPLVNPLGGASASTSSASPASTGSTTPGLNFGGLAGGILGAANSSDVTAARNALTQFRQSAANAVENINSAPTSARVMQGRDAAVQAANAQKEAALSTNLQNALTEQGQQIGAYESAAGLAKPTPTSFGQTVFNPLQGNFSGGSSQLDPQQYASQLADAVAAGRISYNDAVSSLGYAGGAGKAFIDQALIGKGANIPQLEGQAAATQQNTQLAGTTPTSIAAQGASQSVQAYNSLNAANTVFDNQAQTALGILNSTGLNAGVPDYNRAINSLSGRLGSTNVQALTTALTELQVAYTSLLNSSGGTPSAQDQQALATLNPNSSAAQIQASIGQLQNAAGIKLDAAKKLAEGYGSSLGGGGATGGGAQNDPFGIR